MQNLIFVYFTPMTSYSDVFKKIYHTEDVSQRLDLLRRNFREIYEGVSQDELLSYPNDLITKSLLFTQLLANKKFKEINELMTEDLITSLVTSERKHDFFLSKIVLAMYLTVRFFNQESNMFLTMLTINKELNNEESIAVLSNIVIDMLYRAKKYEFIPNYILENINDPEQQAIHNYYRGRLHLVRGEYNKAYHFLQGSIILSSNDVFVKYVEKCLIACLLLKSELSLLRTYCWTWKTRKYFELFECIKSGNMNLFEEIMERNCEDYVEDGLYSILVRLYENVIREGVRKIGLCFKRISLTDIAHLLGMGLEDASSLLNKCIEDGFIFGFVENGIFNSEVIKKENINITDRINDAISTFNYIKGMMRYPKTKPLTYENIDKNSVAYDFNQ